MNYIPELSPFDDYENKDGLMLIIHSNPDPWVFLFTGEGPDCYVQYYKQISLDELKEQIDPTQYSRNTKFGEILNNHNLMKKLHEQEKICAWEITAKRVRGDKKNVLTYAIFSNMVAERWNEVTQKCISAMKLDQEAKRILLNENK